VKFKQVRKTLQRDAVIRTRSLTAKNGLFTKFTMKQTRQTDPEDRVSGEDHTTRMRKTTLFATRRKLQGKSHGGGIFEEI